MVQAIHVSADGRETLPKQSACPSLEKTPSHVRWEKELQDKGNDRHQVGVDRGVWIWVCRPVGMKCGAG